MLLNEITDNETDHRRALNQTGFWGRQGAGCVFLAQDTGRLCLAHRSSAVEQPGTWGTWGGAIDTGEDPQEAVQREVREEAGYRGPMQLIPLMRFEHASGFRYHNFLALVPEEFQPQLNWESSGFAWFEPDQWPSPLHPGVAQLTRDAASRRRIDRYSAAARGGRELDEARVYLRPGQLRGSYRDQQLRDMGFQQDQRGAWWIDRARWEELIRTGRLQENTVAEGKIKLFTDPDYFGAEVDDTGFDRLPIINIPTDQLVGFEPDTKMNRPESKANVRKILAGLKSGDSLPPVLVRKYKNGYQVLDGHHRFWAYKLLGIKRIPSRIVPARDIEAKVQPDVEENFADGKKPGRRGLAKRSGVDCKQSVSKLRSIAKHSSGERQRMAHWCANMKSGRKKSRD